MMATPNNIFLGHNKWTFNKVTGPLFLGVYKKQPQALVILRIGALFWDGEFT